MLGSTDGQITEITEVFVHIMLCVSLVIFEHLISLCCIVISLRSEAYVLTKPHLTPNEHACTESGSWSQPGVAQ